MATQGENPTIPVVTIAGAVDGWDDSDRNPFHSESDDIISRSSDGSEYVPSETSSDRAFIAADHEFDEVNPVQPKDKNEDHRGTWLIKHDAVPVPEAVVRKRVVKMAGQPAFPQYLVRGTWWVTPRYGHQVDALIATFDQDLDRRSRSRAPGPN